MSVTVSAVKTVSFQSPYIGATFQDLTEKIVGRDGLLSGGKTTDNGSTITVEPFRIVQRGIVAETTENVTGLAVPTGSGTWYLIAAIPDDSTASGVVVSVTTDLAVASTALIVAVKSQGQWRNARGNDIVSAGMSSVAPGKVDGFEPRQESAAGVITNLLIGPGRYVDPDGHLRTVESPGSDSIGSFVPFASENLYARNDFIALRHLPDLEPELVQIQGGLFSELESHGYYDDDPPTAAGTGAGYYAVKGIYRSSSSPTPSCKAWGETTNLKTQGGDGGSSWAAITSYGGSDAINSVNVAGQRAADGAFIIVFTEGDDLKVMSVDEATGVQVDAPITIESLTNAISRVHAVMDTTGNLYVVFEHDESTQQVYFTKRITTAGGTFGNALVSPRYVHGAVGASSGTLSSTNDVFPTVGVDSKGVVHVAYVAGSGALEYGNLVYSVLESDGVLRSQDTITNYGLDVDPYDEVPIASAVFDDVRQTSLVVTPHDEVFVATIGRYSGDSTARNVMLFSPSFGPRFDANEDHIIVGVIGWAGPGGKDVHFVSLVVGDQGELWLAWAREWDTDASRHEIRGAVIDPVFAPGGIVGRCITGTDVPRMTAGSGYPPLSTQDDGEWNVYIDQRTVASSVYVEPFRAFRASDGMMAISYVTDTAGTKDPKIALVTPLWYRSPRPHPRDVYLSVFGTIPPVAFNGDQEERSSLHITPVRHSGAKNDPYIVGPDGDFGGINGIADAADALAKTGGRIVVRQGEHVQTRPIFLFGGTEIISNGGIVEWPYTADAGYDWAVYAGNWHFDLTISNVTQSTTPFGTVKIELLEAISPWIREGDFLHVTGGTSIGSVHRIRRILQRSPAIFEVDLEGPLGTPTTCRVLSHGISISGLSVESWRHGNNNSAISAHNCVGLAIRDCSISGSFSGGDGGILLDYCLYSTVSNIGRATRNPADIRLRLGKYNRIENVNLGEDNETTGDPGGFRIAVENTEQWPSIVGCIGNNDANSLQISSGRTTPINLSGTLGKLIEGTPHFMGREKDFAGIHKGVAPTKGTFPQVDFAAGEVQIDGLYLITAAQSITASTTSSTTYWYVMDRLGAIARTTTNPFSYGATDFEDKIVIARARSNPGNTDYESFIDMRRYVNHARRKGPIVVGDTSTNEELYTCATIHGALQWLTETTLSGSHREIIVTDQIDVSGQVPITIDFTSNNLYSLIIRGLGPNAGFQSDDRLTPLFDVVGGTVPASGKISLTLQGLLLECTSSTGGTDLVGGMLQADSGYIDELIIDQCKVIGPDHGGGNPKGWPQIIRPGGTVTLGFLQVSRCELWTARAHAIAVGQDGTEAVDTVHIFENTFVSNSNQALYCILITDEVRTCWIARNTFKRGPYASTGSYNNPIALILPEHNPATPTNLNRAGGRWIVENEFYKYENLGTGYCILVNGGPGDNSPVYILNNKAYEYWYGFVDFNCRTVGSMVVGNYFETTNNAGGTFFTSDAANTGQEGWEIIANNHVILPNDNATASSNPKFATIRGDKFFFTGNYCYGGGRVFDLDDQDGLGGEGEVIFVNNRLEEWADTAVFWYRMDRGMIGGNYMKSTHSNGTAAGIQVSDSQEILIFDNYVEAPEYVMTGYATSSRWKITGNHFFQNLSSQTVPAVYIACSLLVFVANEVRSLGTVDTDNLVCEITTSTPIIIGNAIGSGTADRGALEVGGAQAIVIGNRLSNYGASAARATLRLTATADNSIVIGNVLNNFDGAPVHLSDASSGTDYGTSGAAPGIQQYI
jgi:hypothetical protein